MRRIHPLAGILCCLFSLLCCTPRQSDAPTVQFITPTVNSVHDLSSELEIEIDIFDDSMIEKYRFWLESDHGWEYYTDEKTVQKHTYKVHYTFDILSDITNNFSIHLEAKDDDGNVTHEKVDVDISK